MIDLYKNLPQNGIYVLLGIEGNTATVLNLVTNQVSEKMIYAKDDGRQYVKAKQSYNTMEYGQSGTVVYMDEFKVRTGRWLSNAMWPAGTIVGGTILQNDQITSDFHSSRKEARSICQMLMRDGFGGDGKIFPVKVWVEPEIKK